NRDGSDANFSWNCGVEGIATDPRIFTLRQRQMKNLITALFMAQGTPMVLMGDEIGRTQKGNNNAYCQDNPLSWMDWDLLEKHQDLWRFTQQAIALTQSLQLFQQTHWLTVTERFVNGPHIIWHGVQLCDPDWSDHSHTLAFTLHHPAAGEELHVMFNAYWQPLTFDLPRTPPGTRWHRVIDTALPSPDDITLPTHPTHPVPRDQYRVESRSAVVLITL
ncbi:MAG: glycogen debranching enzyme, partial [Leptolyngbya sp.]|nr:glycogen debranching enzyme [Leptolyngbya sp.]